jgi:hypothetical protein
MLGYIKKEQKHILFAGGDSTPPFGRKEGEVRLFWEKFRPTSPSSLTPAGIA